MSHDEAHAPHPRISLVLSVLSIGHAVWWSSFHLLHLLHVLHVGLLLLTRLLVRALPPEDTPIIHSIWDHCKVALGLTSAQSFMGVGLDTRVSLTLVDDLAEY